MWTLCVRLTGLIGGDREREKGSLKKLKINFLFVALEPIFSIAGQQSQIAVNESWYVEASGHSQQPRQETA